VSERDREGKRGREREGGRECVCMRERKRQSVNVCERESKRESKRESERESER